MTTRSIGLTLGTALALGAVPACSAQERAAAATPHDASARTITVARTAAPPVPTEGYPRPSDAVLRKRLTPLQYDVTQKAATETPFHNTYWDNHEPGIYVDVVSGEPLFSSLDKFESGTGWPSFTRPLEPGNIVTRVDKSLFDIRTEVRSAHAKSHLGHLFADGPKPTGLRYCMNSAAMRFIPVSRLQSEGYGRYASLFGKNRGD